MRFKRVIGVIREPGTLAEYRAIGGINLQRVHFSRRASTISNGSASTRTYLMPATHFHDTYHLYCDGLAVEAMNWQGAMMAMRGLTPKQQRFVAEYLLDLCATKAAIRAGYSAKTAEDIGRQLLRKTPVAAAIQSAMHERSRRTDIDADRTVEELAKIAFSDIRQVFDGNRLRSPDEWSPATAAAIQSVKVRTVNAGEGAVEYVTEIRLWDKVTALDKLARHLGLYNDKLKVSGDSENLLTVLIREIQGSALQPVANPPEDDDDELGYVARVN